MGRREKKVGLRRGVKAGKSWGSGKTAEEIGLRLVGGKEGTVLVISLMAHNNRSCDGTVTCDMDNLHDVAASEAQQSVLPV